MPNQGFLRPRETCARRRRGAFGVTPCLRFKVDSRYFFQLHCCRAVRRSKNMLGSAATGCGRSIHRWSRTGRPWKNVSNQFSRTFLRFDPIQAGPPAGIQPWRSKHSQRSVEQVSKWTSSMFTWLPMGFSRFATVGFTMMRQTACLMQNGSMRAIESNRADWPNTYQASGCQETRRCVERGRGWPTSQVKRGVWIAAS